ncbi:hypothetical protein BHE74_00041206, partial [Ensete ventricosum]
MEKQTRLANSPTVPLTVGDWQHGRTNATGRSTYNAPRKWATGRMAERTRRADQPAAPLTAGDWRDALTSYEEIDLRSGSRCHIAKLGGDLAHTDDLIGLTHHLTL